MMEIYENTDVNYFYDFEYLRLKCQYETNDNSIGGYIQRWEYKLITITDEYLDKYRKDIEKYKELYKNADLEWQILKQEISNNKKASQEEYASKLIDSYFNFESFNNKNLRVFSMVASRILIWVKTLIH